MPSAPELIRVALLGADAGTPVLVHALASSQQFELVGYAEIDPDVSPPDGDAAAALLRQVKQFPSWESLLDLQQIDAVIVARGGADRRADQLRKLVQAGMPVLASHPVVESMLVYYELDMIQRETRSALVPCLSERLHPAIQNLRRLVEQGDASPIGKVEQVVIERGVAEPTRPRVLRQFARDVDLLRAIAGELTRLGAMAASSGAGAHASLGIQLSGPAGVVARWSVVPGDRQSGLKISLLGSRGQAIAVLGAGTSTTIELTHDGQTQSLAAGPWDPADAALDQLAAALAGEAAVPNWVDAARSVELMETVDRSLAKGRTIELHYEEYTEQGTFKGTMTSLGCGLLVLAMLLLGVVAIGEQAGVPYTRFWPYLLLGALVFFLLLQFLMLVFKKAASEGSVALDNRSDGPPGSPIGGR